MKEEEIDTKFLQHKVDKIECDMKRILKKKNKSEKEYETLKEQHKRLESKHNQCVKDLNN